VSTPQIAADSLSIVVPGIFRPLPLSPHSLFEHGLIGQADYDAREVELLLPNEAITFKVGAFQVHCQSDKLQVTTADEAEFERLRDLVAGILRSLTDTKVSQLGINRSVHFFAADNESWNAIGDSLVNNDIWGDALPLPGMRVAVFWGSRTDKFAGRVQVQVEPSSLYPNAVYVAYNDHYELTMVDSQPASREEFQRHPLPFADFDMDLLGPDSSSAEPGDIIYLTTRTVRDANGYPYQTSSLKLRRPGPWGEDELREISQECWRGVNRRTSSVKAPW